MANTAAATAETPATTAPSKNRKSREDILAVTKRDKPTTQAEAEQLLADLAEGEKSAKKRAETAKRVYDEAETDLKAFTAKRSECYVVIAQEYTKNNPDAGNLSDAE